VEEHDPRRTQARFTTDRLKTRFYPESRFGGFTDIDGTTPFYLRVNALAASKDVAIDSGAKARMRTTLFPCGEVCAFSRTK
jgi:hypothetical protein